MWNIYLIHIRYYRYNIINNNNYNNDNIIILNFYNKYIDDTENTVYIPALVPTSCLHDAN